MRAIEASTDISATAERVWDVLTRFGNYPAWNPFVTSIVGVPREGEKLRVRIVPPGRSDMTFKPTILVATRYRQLTWLGHLFLPGLFDGEHTWLIVSQGKTCRLRQTERFTGLLVPLFGAGLYDATRRGFEAMNAALKMRAEA